MATTVQHPVEQTESLAEATAATQEASALGRQQQRLAHAVGFGSNHPTDILTKLRKRYSS